MMKLLPLAIASAFFLLAGYWHGVWNGRWTSPLDEAASAARFQAIPMNLGEWEGSAVSVKGEDSFWTEENSLIRRYRHSVSSESVTVGIWHVSINHPIRTHDPLVCYPFFGWDLVGPSDSYDAKEAAGPGKRATFGRAQFKKNAGDATKQLLIYWSWSADGNWSVPKGDLRPAFPEHRNLYKFYVLQELPPESAADNRPPSLPDFLKTFLPAMNKALFEDPPPSRRAGL